MYFFAGRLVRQRPRLRVESEPVSVPRVRHRLGALHDVESEVEGVSPEDVAHVVAADDDELAAGFFPDAFQAGRTHFPR